MKTRQIQLAELNAGANTNIMSIPDCAINQIG